MYAEFEGQQWNTPIATVFPFGQAIPLLVANPNGFIHAFWTDEQNQLFHSFVPADQFSDPTSWYGVIQLAESAVDFDIALITRAGYILLTSARWILQNFLLAFIIVSQPMVD